MADESTASPPKPRRMHIELSTLERARLWVEIVAFVAAGIWALYTFVYQTQIVPRLEPGHMITSPEVTRIGETAKTYVERARVTLTNDGHTPIDVAGWALSLYGIRDAVAPREVFDRRHNVLVGRFFSNVPLHGLAVISTHGEINTAATSVLPNRHLILLPGDTAQLELAAFVPKTQFAALMLETDLVYVKYPFAGTIPVTITQSELGGLDIDTDRVHGFKMGTDNFFGV